MCDCDNRLGQPMPGDKIWWSYFHKDGTVKIKRWFPVKHDQLCDACHAQEELRCYPNGFIRCTMHPYWAANRAEAYEKAVEYFYVMMGVEYKPEPLP